jgi:hypothetical protein
LRKADERRNWGVDGSAGGGRKIHFSVEHLIDIRTPESLSDGAEVQAGEVIDAVNPKTAGGSGQVFARIRRVFERLDPKTSGKGSDHKAP